MNIDDRLALTLAEACTAIGISKQMFYKLTREGSAPPMIKLKGKNLVMREDLMTWLEKVKKEGLPSKHISKSRKNRRKKDDGII